MLNHPTFLFELLGQFGKLVHTANYIDVRLTEIANTFNNIFKPSTLKQTKHLNFSFGSCQS